MKDGVAESLLRVPVVVWKPTERVCGQQATANKRELSITTKVRSAALRTLVCWEAPPFRQLSSRSEPGAHSELPDEAVRVEVHRVRGIAIASRGDRRILVVKIVDPGEHREVIADVVGRR